MNRIVITPDLSQPARTEGADRSSVLGRPSSQNASSAVRPQSSVIGPQTLRVALLTGGGDKPYALGLSSALTKEGVSLDFIGSDDLAVSELLDNPRVNFLNLRGDQARKQGDSPKRCGSWFITGGSICYAATAKPKIFHILWNNKFEVFDRTVLMLYYRLLGKRVVLTAHNVNAGQRDANDSLAKPAFVEDPVSTKRPHFCAYGADEECAVLFIRSRRG